MSDGLTILIAGTVFMLSIYIVCTTFSILNLKKKHGSIRNFVSSLSNTASEQDWFKNKEYKIYHTRIAFPGFIKFLSKIKVSKLRIVNSIVRHQVRRKILSKLNIEKNMRVTKK